jgi:lysophospholipase L1-like esterase
MNRRLALTVLGSLIVTSSVADAEYPQRMPYPLSESSKILVMGSSSMSAMEWHFKRFAKKANIPIAGRAIGGSRIDTWLNLPRFENELKQFRPTHVFMYIGANDVYTNKSVQTVTRQTTSLFNKIKEANATPVFIGMPSLTRFNGNEPNQELIHAIHSVPEFYYPSKLLTIPRKKDGLHATSEGYAHWAKMVWKWTQNTNRH